MIIQLVAVLVYGILFIVAKYLKHSRSESLDKVKKFQYYYKYYLLTMLLGLSANVVFSSLSNIKTGNYKSTGAAINLILAILYFVAYVTLLVSLLSWLKNLKVGYVHPAEERSGLATGNSQRSEKEGVIENASRHFAIEKEPTEREEELSKDNQSEEMMKEPEKLDYSDKILFEMKELFVVGRFNRYYPFIAVASSVIQLLIVACMHEVRMGQYLCLAALQLTQAIYLMAVRPFKSKINNLKAILMPLLMIILYAMDVMLVGTKVYMYQLELATIIMVLVVLAINLILLSCQIINSYSEEIYECFKPCIMKCRQKKTKYDRMQHR